MPKELERYLLPFRAAEAANDHEFTALRVAHIRPLSAAALSPRSLAHVCSEATYREPTAGVSLSLPPANPLASMIEEHEDTSSVSEAGIYRARAAELRQEAKQTHWLDVRDRVLALAEEYDLLAKHVEHL